MGIALLVIGSFLLRVLSILFCCAMSGQRGIGLFAKCYLRATRRVYPTFHPEFWGKGPYRKWGEPLQNIYVY